MVTQVHNLKMRQARDKIKSISFRPMIKNGGSVTDFNLAAYYMAL
jgi:hypothetical protein